MPYTQENRLIAIDTPLGKDVLLLAGFRGTEALSRLFSFELNILSENHNISFGDIIGKNVTISVVLADEDKRYFNGLISRFSQGRGGGEAGGDLRFSHYRAAMVPWPWLLTRTADSRIFQKLSVPDIVEKIFKEKGFSDFKVKLHDSYEKRDYCVQYRETDFNFVSRLLEEEGIHYFFEHEDGKHTLVLADAPQENSPCPKQKTARCQISAGGWLEEDVITGLEKMQEIRLGKYSLSDFNFEIPNTGLEVNVPSKQKLGPGEREVYDYPGLYAKKAEGDRLAKIRMEEEEAQITKIAASSNCRAFTSGYRFTLSDFYRSDMNNKDYVLTSLEHEANQDWEKEAELSYANHFTCIPFDVPYRPPRLTPRPVVEGTQTAIVAGPSGEEIYTDEHGRVKVQFHWDREGKKNENSSCWIRVSQVSAGAGWGATDIPRIGHEVIVDFLEGDPDRPIITGRVYHGTNRPPTNLPNAGMVSGMKSNSTPGGGGFNEMTMDDTKGKEKITIHAQKDMNATVENDRTTTIVGGSDTLAVQAGTRSVTVKGNTSLTVQAGDRTVNVTGDYKLDTTNEIKMQAPAKITLTCGGSSITIEPGKITISAGDGSSLTLDANALMKSSGGSQVFLDGNALTKSSAGSHVLLDGNALMVSTGGDQVLLDGKAKMSSPGEAVVEAPKSTLSGGGSTVKVDASGVAVTGPKISLNG
jgi:type VI secretion system secreted protein VgrG